MICNLIHTDMFWDILNLKKYCPREEYNSIYFSKDGNVFSSSGATGQCSDVGSVLMYISQAQDVMSEN